MGEMTGQAEAVDVRCPPCTRAAVPDALAERRWFARDELTKESDDVLE